MHRELLAASRFLTHHGSHKHPFCCCDIFYKRARETVMLRGRFAPRALACTLACSSRTFFDSPHDAFVRRHCGPTPQQAEEMLKAIGYSSLDEMTKNILPTNILRDVPLKARPAVPEAIALENLHTMMGKNKLVKSCIGQGYYETVTPPPIQRNMFESQGWYTPYTPYQAEISQGRLESLLNFQTLVLDVTAMQVTNASLLDEATAAFECVHLIEQYGAKKKKDTVFVASHCFASTIEMVRCRSGPIGMKVIVGDIADVPLDDPKLAGIIVQTPDATGAIHDFTELFKRCHQRDILGTCGSDLLASCLVKPVGEMDADVVFGSTQRFGIPIGYGGPSAGFLAVKDEHKRIMPGRLIGISKDHTGKRALRMALQTREQHIKRERATSNICTAQALLANMCAMYGVYHGPEGLKEIAGRIHNLAKVYAAGMSAAGHRIVNSQYFDTVEVSVKGMSAAEYSQRCTANGVNIWVVNDTTVTVSMDEMTTEAHVSALLRAAGASVSSLDGLKQVANTTEAVPQNLIRTSKFLESKVFNTYHSETDLMRYIYGLQVKDFGLGNGMVPLGSCTMKLNPASGMIPLSWPEVNRLHPFVPADQARGYQQMLMETEQWLKDVTGFAAVSIQPNSGAAGEYAGLRVIRAYHESRGDNRHICLIPASAHGTNPASSVLAGFEPVVIQCLPNGRINVDHLKELCKKHNKNIGAVMITYPSTYGVFDTEVRTITEMVHAQGGQVYIDGANLNAMIGLTGPYWLGGDVCHMNLHKSFSIPHGGGGPGMGPIAAREHLAPFMPNTSNPRIKVGGAKAWGQGAQSPYGSASIVNISYMAMTMLGSDGMKTATQMAILNANYLMHLVEKEYKILFKGATGHCAHEFIIDLRPFKASAGIEAEDVAKRLMDYGFHAPTLAFPVVGTLMVEPTESEPYRELHRFAEAMLSIREEIRLIEEGKLSKTDNMLKNAPHTQEVVAGDKWDHPYTREVAAFPVPALRDWKFWPTVGRIDGTYGDRNLIVRCE